MKILAIETSCDDTGIAVLQAGQSGFEVLSSIVSSQAIHQNYGGVFPMMAKREHQKNLAPVLAQSLREAGLLKPNTKCQIPKPQIEKMKTILAKEETLFAALVGFLQAYEKPEVDAIAVTQGPGLEPCLWVGVNAARALSYIWEIPLIPVNHIEAHIAVNFLQEMNGISNFQFPISKQIQNPKSKMSKQIFPALALVVSGGHTQLILVKKIGNYEIVGETRDDAAGECFDKCAKMLGLGYPGGPIIADLASKNVGFPIPHKLPRPMLYSRDYDFSFSGLKTAVLYATKGKKLTEEYVGQMCAEVQQAIVEVLVKKTMQAAEDFNVKTIILGGGVSANAELRKQFEKSTKNLGINCLKPDVKHSTDNGLMIAVAAYFHKNEKAAWKTLAADANLRIG